MFCRNPVNLPQITHKLAESIHSKTYIPSGVCQIHQRANQLAIYGWIISEFEVDSFSFLKFASIEVAMDLQSNILNLFKILMVYFP